jgi:hypothetical protein
VIEMPEAVHTGSDDVPFADDWAGTPGIRLKLLMADIEGARFAVRIRFEDSAEPRGLVPLRAAGQHAHAEVADHNAVDNRRRCRSAARCVIGPCRGKVRKKRHSGGL